MKLIISLRLINNVQLSNCNHDIISTCNFQSTLHPLALHLPDIDMIRNWALVFLLIRRSYSRGHGLHDVREERVA